MPRRSGLLVAGLAALALAALALAGCSADGSSESTAARPAASLPPPRVVPGAVTPAAAGYYASFGSRAGPGRRGYYSYDLGGWHLVSLNANCGKVGCRTGSAQERWLRADLAAHPVRCTLAYWHQPRFSSGLHGNDSRLVPLWRDLQLAGAAVALPGPD